MSADKVRSTATDQLREQAGVVGEDVQELGRIARDVVTEKYQVGREKATEWEKTLEAQIKRNPLKSVLIAASVGLLIGAVLGRR